jgi:hypothetical protein
MEMYEGKWQWTCGHVLGQMTMISRLWPRLSLRIRAGSEACDCDAWYSHWNCDSGGCEACESSTGAFGITPGPARKVTPVSGRFRRRKVRLELDVGSRKVRLQLGVN